ESFRCRAGTANGERYIPLNIQRCSVEIRDRKRPVYGWRRFLLDAIIVHVLDDADDLAPLDLVAHLLNPFANCGRGSAPEFLREVFGNQDNRTAVVDIGPSEVASSDQAGSRSYQESGRHKLEGSDRRVQPGFATGAFRNNRVLVLDIVHWKGIRQAY